VRPMHGRFDPNTPADNRHHAQPSVSGPENAPEIHADPSRRCELLRRRPVARIDGALEEFVRPVGPELAHRRIGLDDGVLQCPGLRSKPGSITFQVH